MAFCSNDVHNLILQFLGTLMDSSTSIRSASRKILKLVKLSSMESFRLSVGGLIENLERHPQVCFGRTVILSCFPLPFYVALTNPVLFQDEPEIFCVMFHMGRNHGKFVVSIINEMSEEVSIVFYMLLLNSLFM